MIPNDASFIRRCVKRYYFERFDLIELPPHMPMREFGYRQADSGMVRHLQMRDAADLRVMLLQTVPLEVYVSNARYLFPDRPMPEKVWEDAHLIFDIDAKDLNLECRPSHAVSICGRCGHDTGGRCEHRNAKQVSVACPACIKAAKDQVGRLLDILADDLGIREGVRVYFSGNEGFHVHVDDANLAGLKAAERADLADYVAFQGVLPDRLGFSKTKAPSLPKPHEGGWRGRFARAVRSRRSGAAREITSGGYGAVERNLGAMNLGVRIDPGVTMDVHRIFRMPGTINGKSCMAKVACTDLGSFNPYADAVVVSDEPVYVRASCPVQFRMMKRRFGPYANEYVLVPSYAAAYMICKGLAHAVG